MCVSDVVFFFFKQKTAYEMRISDWSSDVCSSDLASAAAAARARTQRACSRWSARRRRRSAGGGATSASIPPDPEPVQPPVQRLPRQPQLGGRLRKHAVVALQCVLDCRAVRLVGRCHAAGRPRRWLQAEGRSEERRGGKEWFSTG